MGDTHGDRRTWGSGAGFLGGWYGAPTLVPEALRADKEARRAARARGVAARRLLPYVPSNVLNTPPRTYLDPRPVWAGEEEPNDDE